MRGSSFLFMLTYSLEHSLRFILETKILNNMLTLQVFTLLLMLSDVKSEVDFKTMCKNNYSDMNNTQIDVSTFCTSNTCIEKCCGEGEMFSPRGNCTNTKDMFQRLKKIKHLISEVNYTTISLYDRNTKKKSEKYFVFIKNQRSPDCTFAHSITNEFVMLEVIVYILFLFT